MVSFFTAGSLKKNTIFGAARKNFGPSYFMTPLDDVTFPFYPIYLPNKKRRLGLVFFS